MWSCLEVNVGLIVACLPALRPYLRLNNKSSSARYEDSSGPKMPSQAKHVRRPEEHGLEVIMETSGKGDAVQVSDDNRRGYQLEHGNEEVDTSDRWLQQGGSEVELVEMQSHSK